MINYSKLINQDKPESAVIILDDAETLASTLDNKFLLTTVFHEKAFLFQRLGKNAESLNQLFKAKSIINSIDESSFDKNMSLAYIRVLNGTGTVYFEMNKYEEAIEFFQEGIAFLNKQNSNFSEESKKRYLFYFYNNLGGVYLKIEEYVKAEYYLNKATQLIDRENNIKAYANILNNLSIAYREMGDLVTAKKHIDDALDICLKQNFKKELVSTYNNMGSYYIKKNSFINATNNFFKAFEQSKHNKYGSSGTVALNNLTTIYGKREIFDSAYLYSSQLIQWKDSLKNEEEIRRFAEVEIQENFDSKLNEEKLRQQQIELEQNTKETIYIFAILGSVLALVIFILLYFLQTGRSKQNKLEAEKNKLLRQKIELENKKLEEQLEVKKKELATNVMYSIRRNEVIAKTVADLKAAKLYFNKGNHEKIDSIILELESSAVNEVWKEFELRFHQVHIGFYDRLNEILPNISVNEKRLCAFLRLNMSTKEISAITQQSINSISVARTRLRKKLQLDQDSNLVSFLESI